MRKLTWILSGGLAGASLLAACAMGNSDAGSGMARGAAGPMTSLCTGPETQVTIDPLNLGATTGTIKVNPGTGHVNPNGGGVRWKFNQNTYSFTSDGVVFKTNLPGPASAPATGDPTVYAWCFNNTSSTPDASWSYTIKFSANSAPTKIWTCDPTIVNRSTLTPLAVETVTCTSP
ncbi:MAG: hypothetical protein ABI887_09665 [Burkholderiales bacterium]